MSQLTLRVPQDLAERLKAAAGERGLSLNRFAMDVLSAAVDPRFAGDEAAVLRERLARAGLLAEVAAPPRKRPPRAAVKRARAAAGKGRPVSRIVGEGRR
jgi:uncharacterized protein (DUF1778 family)